MIQDLRKNYEPKTEKMQEIFTKDLQELKNKQTELNSTLEGINNRVTEAEEWTNDLEDRMMEVTARKQDRKKNEKKKREPKRPLGQP